ncbi:MAG TPA: OmpH family outer membrane protein [Planctomycetota bacterium]
MMGRILAIMAAVAVVSGGVSGVRAEDAKRIGVVNVSRVFNSYEKVKVVQDKMEKLFDADRKSIATAGDDLKKWEDKIRVDPRDPKANVEFFQEIQKFELTKLQLEMRFRKLSEEVEKRRKDEMKSVLNDIKAAIRTVGTAEKFDLVLRAPEFDEDFDPAKAANPAEKERNEPQSAAELVRKFRENPVLYFSQGVDVTQPVIDKLNGDFKKTAP